VTIKDFAFSPNVVSIPVGGSVTFKNLDSAAHTATDSSGAFDSGNLDTGKSYTFTFKKAGTFKYVCTYHASMHATIVVGASAPPPSATPDSSGY
jgi:plastocyanin